MVAVALVLLAGGLWAFQPWRLFTHSTVDEAIPAAFEVPVEATTTVETTTGPPAASATTPPPVAAPPVTTTKAPAPASAIAKAKPAGPTVLASGAFVTQEHKTTGTARVLEQNGERLLRLEGLSTSDGPDLHVWLSDATAGGEWGKYDDGRYVKLGKLKATDGNQNYAIPADADLSGLRSVVIWCDRFNVAFGSAPLAL
ncbi:DM13 domain-containing protein [Actinokineospora sp.]|uniref:DM13 domain-containing protein n=1 Tax=Actinokineospora sp. TaxID=1872133 RepID=UPI00403842CC